MHIVHDPVQLPPFPKGSVLTIGNFDGVHLAHQQLLRRVVAMAHERGAVPIAVTFDPHPIRVLAPARAPRTLSTLAGRAKLIEEQGIELLMVLPFTRELAHLSPAEFVAKVLVERLRAVAVSVGPNFRFGYRQAGDTTVLQELSRESGFLVDLLPDILVRGQQVSSSCIRKLLSEGKVHMAGRLLGRPFSNSGAIVSGRGVGHRQTVPTLNLDPAEEQIPQTGVYVTRARLAGSEHVAVTNIGYKPTFGDHPLTIETFLLNFQGEIAETETEIMYLHRLRDEIKFQNPAMLKLQIQEDVRRALKFFRLMDRFGRREGEASGIGRRKVSQSK
ncbi:MAG: bifunctional riboflavin kinase/FAD synthetase [Terriglobia bacterium]